MTRHFLVAASVLALAFNACSSDDSTPAAASAEDTTVNPNEPASMTTAGTGGTTDDGAGDTASADNGGATGMATGTGGSEANPADDLDLSASDGGSDNGGGAMASAGGSQMATAGAGGGAMAVAGAGGGEMDVTGELDDMSFFVTSRGGDAGGNFGGIDGADAFCAQLAAESPLNVAGKTWRAYLSTSTQAARDRIGTGPWMNFNGIVVANDIDQLHDQGANGSLNATWPTNNSAIPLDEQGDEVPNQPVTHDILTGSNLDGTVADAGTCSDWTSEAGGTQNGHSNRAGGGNNPQAWGSAHATGCGRANPGQNFEQGTVTQGGGRGSIYCFAID